MIFLFFIKLFALLGLACLNNVGNGSATGSASGAGFASARASGSGSANAIGSGSAHGSAFASCKR